ncbi:ASTRA-associated protein [Trichinella pseudospiralis]
MSVARLAFCFVLVHLVQQSFGYSISQPVEGGTVGKTSTADRTVGSMALNHQAYNLLIDIYSTLMDASMKIENLFQTVAFARPIGKTNFIGDGKDKRYDLNSWEFMRFGK